jgi:hypothetical protein
VGALGLEAEAVVGPAGDQPFYVGGDGIDVLDLLLGRVEDKPKGTGRVLLVFSVRKVQ